MIGVIFDFNGTLYEDAQIQKHAWNQMALKYRGRELSSAENEEHMHGRNNQHTLEYILGRPLTATELTKLSDEKEQIYRHACAADKETFHLRPGVPEYFAALKAAGIPFTVATASVFDNVQFFFDAFGMDRWIDINTVAYNDGKLRGKPAPDIFLRAAANINVPAERTIVFEDASSGIAAAEAAHAGWTVGVQTSDNREMLRGDDRLVTVIGDYTDVNDFLNIEFLQGL
ncbi:HAD family hydrolase [Lacticaseibacillus zhaodongensis]|uniref:HAD family hydrolase n=1 Tax=Lacticaseibacillus zhaodongensis TaxID=2668065 RepID=UPI0012D2E648|nr:HAD family phosphatase [Lacticaseibacillus zhaodongensis]